MSEKFSISNRLIGKPGVLVPSLHTISRADPLTEADKRTGGSLSLADTIRIMKKVHLIFLILGPILFIPGCAGKQVDPNLLESPDKQAIYNLMVERCAALRAQDINRFIEIYTEDSPEIEWIEKEIPMWIQHGVTYYVHRVKRISIVGSDAAASFNLRGSTASGWPLEKDVEALFVKKGSKWKIESVGQR